MADPIELPCLLHTLSASPWDAEMAMQAEGPAPQCLASPPTPDRGAALFTTPVHVRLQEWGRLGWDALFPGSPCRLPPAPLSAVLSSLIPISAWGGRGAACPQDLPVRVGAAEGQQHPGRPGSPPAAGQQGTGQVSVGVGMSHLAVLGNTWQRLGLPWGWGAAPWARGQMRCFWDRGIDGEADDGREEHVDGGREGRRDGWMDKQRACVG